MHILSVLLLACPLLIQSGRISNSGIHEKEDSASLLQGRTKIDYTIEEDVDRRQITIDDLVAAESAFTSKSGKVEVDHANMGGDRMSDRHHNYSPIYSKYITHYLEKGQITNLAEIGILTGTGLAMWSKLFPDSNVYGFDIDPSSYENNRDHMRKLGFDDSRVKVTRIDQTQDNQNLLQQALAEDRPNIVIDDGLHTPEAGLKTFLNMKDFLADRFVYFIEDIIAEPIQNGDWDRVSKKIVEECDECEFALECPPTSFKTECLAVIHNLGLKGAVQLPKTFKDVQLPKKMSFSQLYEHHVATRKFRLEHVSSETIDVDPEWRTGKPLTSCPSSWQHEAEGGIIAADDEPEDTPDANLNKAVRTFCAAGLSDMVELKVDTRFRDNYERFKDEDGWIPKALLTYMGLKAPRDKIGAEEDLLVQSIHRFSKYPVVLVNYGTHVPKHMRPDRFPNLVLMHAHESATDLGKGFNLNKLNSMMFAKIKGGLVVDADQWISSGVDIMIDRAFDETTKDYPYSIMPVHFMSRDPDDSSMKTMPPAYTFRPKSANFPKQTMHWGHAHPTWTHYALPWIAKWTSYVLAPEKTSAPSWLKEEGFVSDEPLMNFAIWAEGLTKQWCKYDVPDINLYEGYLAEPQKAYDGYPSVKYYPKGKALMFFTMHGEKRPQKSFDILMEVYASADKEEHRKPIMYDEKWFGSGKELREYDPDLKCMVP
jgi:hypothetical protein